MYRPPKKHKPKKDGILEDPRFSREELNAILLNGYNCRGLMQREAQEVRKNRPLQRAATQRAETQPPPALRAERPS